MIGVLWTFSILGLVGIDLSLVTISGLPILIGLGIDFAIQIHNRVEEEVVLDRDPHPIAETLANLAPPLIVTRENIDDAVRRLDQAATALESR